MTDKSWHGDKSRDGVTDRSMDIVRRVKGRCDRLVMGHCETNQGTV